MSTGENVEEDYLVGFRENLNRKFIKIKAFSP